VTRTDKFKSKVKRLMAQGCPSHEQAIAICEQEAAADIKAATRVLWDFETRGGRSLAELRKELGMGARGEDGE